MLSSQFDDYRALWAIADDVAPEVLPDWKLDEDSELATHPRTRRAQSAFLAMKYALTGPARPPEEVRWWVLPADRLRAMSYLLCLSCCSHLARTAISRDQVNALHTWMGQEGFHLSQALAAHYAGMGKLLKTDNPYRWKSREEALSWGHSVMFSRLHSAMPSLGRRMMLRLGMDPARARDLALDEKEKSILDEWIETHPQSMQFGSKANDQHNDMHQH